MQSIFEANLKANIRFGTGTVSEIGTLAAKYGKTAMVITCPWPEVQVVQFTRVLNCLEAAGIRAILYDRACPNPTTDSIEEAAAIAREEGVELFIGLGGGSAMDTAKGAALMFAHPGSVWDYTYVAQEPRPIFPQKLLPVIAVTTTSGTGSHVTPYCVLQNPRLRRKTCVVATNAMIPTLSLVDPDLMLSMPPYITATTGFDVFAHAFEAYVDDNANPLIETFALQAIELAVNNLAKVYRDGFNRKARYNMAYGDTLAGICIALNNTTMPHDIGQAIVGKNPRIAHGQSLAIIYPEYIGYALPFCEKKLANVARLFDQSLKNAQDREAAGKLKDLVIAWQKEIHIYASGKSLGLGDEIMEAVIEEAWQGCSFITQKAGQTREQIAQMMGRIWNQ